MDMKRWYLVIYEMTNHIHQKMSAYQVAATLTKCNIEISQFSALIHSSTLMISARDTERSCLLGFRDFHRGV